MNNEKIIQETIQKLSKLVDKSRYSSKISYRLRNKRKGDFLTNKEKIHFLLDINRIPTINKKFIEKAKDQIKTGGNLRATNATWNCEPENYYEGAVEIKIKDYHDTLRLRAGRNSDNKPTDAVIQNGMMKLVVLGDNTSQCRFTTYIYDPDLDDYASAQTWAISATNSETEWQSWQSIQILKNEPQIATIRLTTHYNATTRDGRLVFDITLKRGSRNIEFVASQWQTQQLNVKSVSALAGTNATGYVVASSANNEGNKYMIGSPTTYTADTTNLGISVSGTTAVKGFIGAVVGSASGANTADNVRDQYLDSIFETVRIVKS
jgi:hypothetical protein